MSIEPAIRTTDQIDSIIYSNTFSGGWKKRKNAQAKMIAWSNELVDSELESLRSELRKLKADGVKEGELRQQYARISAIQRMRID